MEFPVRCFTCGAVIGDLYEQYKTIAKEKNPDEAFSTLGVERYCCRRMFVSHVEMGAIVSAYKRL
ncbi:DNA-directed RNA polymerase subunit N [Candidatus Micrarchaeota archaeon]|nr:DNA-directed RNA polymerase subunit N [Candidatus Micrarchaeota archaeon]